MTYQHQVVYKVVESIRALISKPASSGHTENLAAPEKCGNDLESRRCYRYSALYFPPYFLLLLIDKLPWFCRVFYFFEENWALKNVFIEYLT